MPGAPGLTHDGHKGKGAGYNHERTAHKATGHHDEGGTFVGAVASHDNPLVNKNDDSQEPDADDMVGGGGQGGGI